MAIKRNRFAISQAGFAARTLTLMQGSEEKEKKERSTNRLNRETCQGSLSTNRTRSRESQGACSNHYASGSQPLMA